LGIVIRRSTGVLAMNDVQLVAGVRFIREHLFEGISDKDIARAAGLSRHVFERRFAAQVGRPPKAEVLRLRLERINALLADTDWPLAQIAGRTGFKYGEYLRAVLSEMTGTPPGKFRQSGELELRGHEPFPFRSAKP